MSGNARFFSWFGKLPCIGDFCSHNMPETLLSSMDTWLSSAMQQGEEKHGEAWTAAYFQAPIHGFLLGEHTLPALGGLGAVGLLMPSVDKAGRAFPFVLMERLAHPGPAATNGGPLTQSLPPWALQWFRHAHALCASALSEDWSLEQLGSALNNELNTKPITAPPGDSLAGAVSEHANNSTSYWYRIEFSGVIECTHQCSGLPDQPAFESLLGLSSPT